MKASDSLTAIGPLTILALLGAFATPVLARPAKAPTAPVARPAPAPSMAPRVDDKPAPSAVSAQLDAPPPWPEPLWLVDAPSAERGSGDRGSGERRGGKRGAENHEGQDHQNRESIGAGAPAASAPTGGVPAANAPTDATESVGMMNMGHGGVKNLVLRRGADPANAPVVKLGDDGVSLQVLSADGKRWETPFTDMGKGGLRTKVELENFGFYSAYLLRKSAHGGVLDVQVAQAELLKGGMGHGVEYDPALFKPTLDDTAPIELVREHGPDERLMTSIHSGDKAVFLVRAYGKPLAGARVSLSTQQGWRKTVTSDQNGRVEFTLIRDYFPAWSDFNRSQSSVFLVWAEAETPEAGVYNGQGYSTTRYQTSMTARYYPAPYDYRSQAYALAIVMFVTAFTAFAVWFYRQRRQKPFKEIVFDEKLA